MGLFGQLPLLLGHLAVVFGVGDYVLKAHLVLTQPLSRVLNQLFRQAQPPGYLKGVGLARHPDGQAVGGAQGLYVELHRGVFHPRGGQGVGLELGVMGGGQHRGLPPLQFPQDGHRQGGALGGVGARAQLVQQHQGISPRLLQDGYDVGHVGGEGGQGLLDGLFVADVGEHLGEHRHLAARPGGNLQPGLGHQGEQAAGLQGDGLAPGIGAGDHQLAHRSAQPQVDGHHLVPVDEGVPGGDQMDAPLPVQLGGHRLHVPPQLGLGKDEIQLGQQEDVVPEPVPVRGHPPGQVQQNPLDLLLLLGRPLL